MNPIFDRYEQAKNRFDTFFEKHSVLVTEYENIKTDLLLAEDEVKTACKEQKKNMEVAGTHFSFIPVYKKWYDAGLAYKLATKAEKKLLEEITETKVEIDFEALTKLCRAGKINDRIRIEAYREEEKSPRVLLEKT